MRVRAGWQAGYIRYAYQCSSASDFVVFTRMNISHELTLCLIECWATLADGLYAMKVYESQGAISEEKYTTHIICTILLLAS